MDLVYHKKTEEVNIIEERLKELSLAYKLVKTEDKDGLALVDGSKSYVGLEEMIAYVNLLDKEKGQWYYCDC